MISSVPKKYRAFGNATAQIFLNLLGFLPSPFLYGLICELTGGRDSQWGMVMIMFWSIFGLASVSFAYIHDRKKRDRKTEKNYQKLKEDENQKNNIDTHFQIEGANAKYERKISINQNLANKTVGHIDLKDVNNLNLSMHSSIVSSFNLPLVNLFSSKEKSKNSDFL